MLGLGKVAKAYKALRLLIAVEKAYKKGVSRMDKPMMASMTVWGIVIAEAAKVLKHLAELLGGTMAFGEFLPIVATAVGIVIAAIGARKAVGKVIASGNGK
jgi:hypothetical protein